VTQKNETGSGTNANGKPRGSGTSWPNEVRLRLARSVVEERLSTRAVARQLGVPYTTALDWVKRYREGGATAFEAPVRKGSGRWS
jgi:transposase-like protein